MVYPSGINFNKRQTYQKTCCLFVVAVDFFVMFWMTSEMLSIIYFFLYLVVGLIIVESLDTKKRTFYKALVSISDSDLIIIAMLLVWPIAAIYIIIIKSKYGSEVSYNYDEEYEIKIYLDKDEMKNTPKMEIGLFDIAPVLGEINTGNEVSGNGYSRKNINISIRNNIKVADFFKTNHHPQVHIECIAIIDKKGKARGIVKF